MAQRDAGAIILRLDLRGQEKLKQDLEELGPVGARIFRQLERESKPAQDGLGGVGDAAEELKGGVNDLAGRLGPFGRALQAIGPIGLGVAAALGAVTAAGLAFVRWLEASRETMRFAGDLDTMSRNAGVAAERLLAFRSELQLAGGEAGRADTAIEEFSKRLGEFRSIGTGEAREGLAALGLDRELQSETLPIEEALDRVLDRLAEIEDPSQRLSLADKLGLRDAAPLLSQSADSIERIRDRAGEINALLSGETLDRLAAGDARVRELELQRERNRQVRDAAVSDIEVRRQELITALDTERTAIVARRIPLEERGEDILRLQLETEQRRLEQAQDRERYAMSAVDVQREIVEAVEDQYDAMRRIAGIEAELERRRQSRLLDEQTSMSALQTLLSGGSLDADGNVLPGPAAATGAPAATLEDQRAAMARLEAAMEAARTPQERLVVSARELREAYALLTEEQRAEIGVTDAWVARMIAAQRVALGLADATSLLSAAERDKLGLAQRLAGAQADWQQIAAAQVSAETAAAERINAINAALEARLAAIGPAIEGSEDFAIASRAIAEAERDAEAAIKAVNAELENRRLASEQGSADAEREAELERVKNDVLAQSIPLRERLAAYEAQLNTLVAQGTITSDQAASALARRTAELQRGTLAQTAARYELDLFMGVLDGSINSLEDFGRAAVAVFQRVILEMIRTRIEAQGMQSIFGALFGGLFGGGIGGVAGKVIGKGLGFNAGIASAGLPFGGGRAEGGAVEPGYFYRVNERGQEFIAPTAPMTVLPADTFGRGRGARIHVDRLIVSGTDAEEGVMRAMARLEGRVAEVERAGPEMVRELRENLPGETIQMLRDASERGY